MNHSHVLYDSDPHFKIDPISRKIINESSTKTTLVQYDHNSERFTFEMKRIVEGHDISLCNLVEIHYLNVESNTKTMTQGVYTVDDLHVSEDDDQTVVCSWLVGNNATQLVGQLQFIVRFACVNDTTGKIDYVWNSGVFSGISIQSGIYNLDTSSDNFPLPFNFVTTIDGKLLKFFYGTKAEYNALSYEERQGLFALITDDTTKADLEKRIEDAIVFSGANVNINTLRTDLASGVFIVKKALCDQQGNVIHETYGNFSRNWEGGLQPANVQLSENGIYLFQIGLEITDFDPKLPVDMSREVEVSAIVCFNGNETCAPLIDASSVDSASHEIFRLRITNDGIVSVQSHYSSVGGEFSGYTDAQYVSIYYKRIM